MSIICTTLSPLYPKSSFVLPYSPLRPLSSPLLSSLPLHFPPSHSLSGSTFSYLIYYVSLSSLSPLCPFSFLFLSLSLLSYFLYSILTPSSTRLPLQKRYTIIFITPQQVTSLRRKICPNFQRRAVKKLYTIQSFIEQLNL